jgi:hypothetical protein
VDSFVRIFLRGKFIAGSVERLNSDYGKSKEKLASGGVGVQIYGFTKLGDKHGRSSSKTYFGRNGSGVY